MSDDPNVSRHPHMIERGPDSMVSNQAARCIEINGLHLCPAVNGMVFSYDDTFVGVSLARNTHGLCVQLTPDGARELAAAMIASADEVERDANARANDQLAAILAKKGPHT